jgi:hypothetical protein
MDNKDVIEVLEFEKKDLEKKIKDLEWDNAEQLVRENALWPETETEVKK